MQSICLLFAGQKGLDDVNFRQSVLRIPEVSRRLKEAQRILDQSIDSDIYVDLFSFVNSLDSEFESHSNLKSLAATCVQVGLFDRLIKFRSRPQFLVGRVNGLSAMRVSAGLQSFQDLVVTSPFCQENTLMGRFANQKNSKLFGTELEEYGVLAWNVDGFYEEVEMEQKEAVAILSELSKTHILTQCIHVGPTYEFWLTEFEKKDMNTLASMSSIDLDPILNSFWKSA
jgi:hypothetical protein